MAGAIRTDGCVSPILKRLGRLQRHYSPTVLVVAEFGIAR